MSTIFRSAVRKGQCSLLFEGRPARLSRDLRSLSLSEVRTIAYAFFVFRPSDIVSELKGGSGLRLGWLFPDLQWKRCYFSNEVSARLMMVMKNEAFNRSLLIL